MRMALDEVIADASEIMFQDSALSNLVAKQNPGLMAKAKEWLTKFINSIKEAMRKLDPHAPEAKALMQMHDGALKYSQQLQDAWDAMATDSLARRTAEGDKADSQAQEAVTQDVAQERGGERRLRANAHRRRMYTPMKR